MQFLPKFRWRLLVLATLISLTACQDDVDPNATGTAPGKGSADFTKYVAVGNSLTSGFADGGLYRDGQLNSYPNILATQFKTVGGGNFVQPLFTEARAAGSGYLKLIKVPSLTNPASLLSSIGQVAPGAARGGTTANGDPLLDKFTDANQNLGVPGISVSDVLTAGYGSTRGNQYFERFLNTPTTTYLQYVSDNIANATFFSCWLGNNDALGYATSGGITPLTPTALFTTNFTAVMAKLTENNRKGVVIGIPNIVTTPYFTLVTGQIGTLLQLVNATGLVIQSKTASGGLRQSKAGDYFLFAYASSFLDVGKTTVGTMQGAYGLSTTNPIPDSNVLDTDEVATLNAQISVYNTLMKAQADAKGLAYVDPNSVLSLVTKTGGLTQDGITYTGDFIQGGVFSLDGIHLTPAGYALIANEILKGINTKYSSTIPLVNTSSYRRVLLQQ